MTGLFMKRNISPKWVKQVKNTQIHVIKKLAVWRVNVMKIPVEPVRCRRVDISVALSLKLRFVIR